MDDDMKETNRPPNPLYRRTFTLPVKGGSAVVHIPAPGDVILQQDAKDMLDWLAIIQRHLEREAART